MESIWNGIATALVSELTGSNTAKAKWNACYAMGNIFRNRSLPGLLSNCPSIASFLLFTLLFLFSLFLSLPFFLP
jgi:hypothetical protein